MAIEQDQWRGVGLDQQIQPASSNPVVVNGELLAMWRGEDGPVRVWEDRCPHRGGSLAAGVLTGLVTAAAPGQYSYAKPGEILRCPWHGWEFDVRTGQSYCAGLKTRARPLPVSIAPGSDIIEGPYKAETFPVRVEESYVVVEV